MDSHISPLKWLFLKQSSKFETQSRNYFDFIEICLMTSGEEFEDAAVHFRIAIFLVMTAEK